MKKLKINSKQFNTELSTLTDKDLKAVYGGFESGSMAVAGLTSLTKDTDTGSGLTSLRGDTENP